MVQLQLQISGGSHTDTRSRIDTTEASRDTIIPSLNAIRQLPSVNETVTGILASYDGQVRQNTLQGKTSRRSARYNNYDMVSTPPEIRWPNEGFHGSSGKKRLLYDDLSMPQWVGGQLTKILHMQNQVVAKQALVQVICAMKDAASLPFTALKNAWACSMHDLEEGNLSWGDATQWALNRLSASQVSIINLRSTSQKNSCHYFNESTCSHDTHHGWYRHMCSFCLQQGRMSNHPESKCNFKKKKADKTPTTTS